MTRHHTLVRIHGEFGQEALETVRAGYPWRYVTRCESTIIVWPVGATWVSHQPEAVLLRGSFDVRDKQAVQDAHPGRTVTHDGNLLTVWPCPLPAPTNTPRQ
ncbi:hypothetical protein [Streptomyces sp. RKAG290]|uniref:hypothetical protein n=1 Tax=Streptomyces sp. RKAG290 TaxID=2888348 RepID=UPI00203398BF|nr:hypothetical protein [Streptomyces sp. RKAG290]MCM2410757.1 hypothetical protein [Streptomyces sp. RKAG290]